MHQKTLDCPSALNLITSDALFCRSFVRAVLPPPSVCRVNRLFQAQLIVTLQWQRQRYRITSHHSTAQAHFHLGAPAGRTIRPWDLTALSALPNRMTVCVGKTNDLQRCGPWLSPVVALSMTLRSRAIDTPLLPSCPLALSLPL